MKISKMGYGSYRVSAGDAGHYDTLKKALYGGINLIDTSSNYSNGQSEVLIGQVLQDASHHILRQDVVIVSKFGYIQGDNLARHNEGSVFPDTVHYDPHCLHSIHPQFMEDQLDRSLQRLNSGYIDVYLLHNPEYYLMHNVKKPGDREPHRKEMLSRIRRVFSALESQVERGFIRSYGISSNSFGKKEEDLHFLPYEGLLNMAREAAREAGQKDHHFTTVQLPANLLETEGLKGCVPWARENGLAVLINRPLNAFDGSVMHRLAGHPRAVNYRALLDGLQDTLGGRRGDEVAGLITEMDEKIGSFNSIDRLEYAMHQKIIPFLGRAAQGLAGDQLNLLESFLDAYWQEALHRLDARTMEALKSRGYKVEGPIEEFALGFLMDYPGVTCVLNGMKRMPYVDLALRLMKSRG